jgi:hypothetical protein
MEPLPAMNVLFIEEEMNAAYVQDRMRLLYRPPKKCKLHLALSTAYKLSRPGDLKSLRDYCMQHEIKVVFLDPFSSVIGAKDENDNAEISRVLDEVRRALVDDPAVGCTVVLIHHPAKNAQGSETSLRGAGDILGKADHAVRFSKVENMPRAIVKIIKSRLADMSAMPKLTLEFRKSARANGDEGLEVALIERDTSTQSEESKKSSNVAGDIRATMAKSFNGLATQKEVVEAMGMGRTGTFKRAWKTLQDEGIVVYEKENKAFRLHEPDGGSQAVYDGMRREAPPVDPMDE